jgi:hypothetical protein
MKEHKDMVRQYIDFYKTKLWQKKEDLKLKKNFEELESRLDVFNITLARRQAEVQVHWLSFYLLFLFHFFNSNFNTAVSFQIERMRINEQKMLTLANKFESTSVPFRTNISPSTYE